MVKSITDLKQGDKGLIISLIGGQGLQKKLRNMGVREGKIAKVAVRQPFGGPLVLEIDGRKTTIGRGMAIKILVEKL